MSEKNGPLMQQKILNHGFVELIDVLGSDQAVVNAARTSYDKGTKSVSSTSILLRYLMRHKHLGPFEFGEAVFRIRCPMFVARQWFRHRTGSYNEVSLRYSEAVEEFYQPDPKLITTQDLKNKQARTDEIVENAEGIVTKMQKDTDLLTEHYNEYLGQGVAREIARINLPLSLYTSFMFKMDLRNLLNFFTLRFDSHAQYEIQQYAKAMLEMVEQYFPETIAAWKDYTKESLSFSSSELKILRLILLEKHTSVEEFESYLDKNQDQISMAKLEQTEFIDKIKDLLS